MPLSFFTQSVTRIRPSTKTSRGSTVPDWDNAETLVIKGCSVQPASTSLSQDGRVLGVGEGFTLYMPVSADVAEGDRIQYDGDVYTVMGAVKTWFSPTGRITNKQASLERWSG